MKLWVSRPALGMEFMVRPWALSYSQQATRVVVCVCVRACGTRT